MRASSLALAISGLTLCLAMPAAAKGRAGAQPKRHRVQPAQMRPAPIITAVRQAAPGRQELVVPGPAPQSGYRTREEVALTDRIDLGIGLFNVLGTSEKSVVRERTSPRIDVGTPERRVAAIGMRVSF